MLRASNSTLVAAQTYTYGMPRRVRKSILGGWVVTNHPAGNQSFATWREAQDYAAAPCYLWNASAA